MEDILKVYCKVPRGFVKEKSGKEIKCTHVKCTVRYNLGGVSWGTGEMCKRGYYLYVTPVVRQKYGDGCVTESFQAFTGGKLLLVECARRSSNKETLAKVMYEKTVRAALRRLFDDLETIDMSELPDLEAGLNRSGT